jgi:cytidyltransferase-like protein
MDKIVLITGGFDPIHSGHIQYIKAAKNLGSYLIVGLNSDAWLQRKKGKSFLPFAERKIIIENIKLIDDCIAFDDNDNSAKDAIYQIRKMCPDNPIIFANGGDRTEQNIPEMDVMDGNVEFVFGVGGTNKKNSSSWILEEWKAPKTERQWGYYRVLHEVPGTKVKELTVNPKQSLSMQRHQDRSEYWHIAEGECMVNGQYLKQHDHYHIGQTQWHQLTNPYQMPCKIVEIQYGKQCIEEDIERKE